MRKKCLAVLAALLVLAMGATSVFAATSPTAEDAVVEKLNSAVSSVTVSGSDENVTTSEVSNDTYAMALGEVLNEGDTIVAMADITYTGEIDGAVTVEISVPGIEPTDSVYVMHYRTLTNSWEYLTPSDVSDGKVTVSMSAFSPIFVVVGSSKTADGDDNTGDEDDDNIVIVPGGDTNITDDGNTNVEIDDNGNTNNVDESTKDITDNGNTNYTMENSNNTKIKRTRYVYIYNYYYANDVKDDAAPDDSVKATTLAATTVTAGTSNSDAAPQTGEGLPVLPISIVAVAAAIGVVALCGTKARKGC